MGMEIASSDGEKIEKDESEEEEEEDVAEEVEEVGLERSEQQQQRADLRALKLKPGILFVGPPAVGKRTILNRLLARGRRSAQSTSESGATCQGWAIDTKYYTANVCVWTARLGIPALEDAESIEAEFGRCEALVMVFDLSSASSFQRLQEWMTGVERENFEVLLCVGNKADRVPGHFGHAEYRRKLQKSGESSSDPHPEFWEFGIERSEGSSLLDDEGGSVEDRRRCCIEWCADLGIEYIECCAVNEVFDDCLSVDGDLQGVARIHGALCAHMWPGLVMKDGSEGIDAAPSNGEQEEVTSDDDSDYYIEYELLSNGSAEPWEASGWEDQWSFSAPGEGPVAEVNGSTSISTDLRGDEKSSTSISGDLHVEENSSTSISRDLDGEENSSTSISRDLHGEKNSSTSISRDLDGEENSSTSVSTDLHGEDTGTAADLEAVEVPQACQRENCDAGSSSVAEPPSGVQNGHGVKEQISSDNFRNQEIEDMEQLMNEMASIRMNMQSMSDHNRRDMAARLALRMASMFKEDDD